MSMDKFKDIFKAMSEEGALLEVRLSLGQWENADYQTICKLIGDDAKFSCRVATNSYKHSPATFSAPVTDKEMLRSNASEEQAYRDYYYPDTELVKVIKTSWTETSVNRKRLSAGLVYLREEQAQERLKAMLEIQPCMSYTVVHNGLVQS